MSTSEPALLIIGSFTLVWGVFCVFVHHQIKQELKREKERKAALLNGDEIFIVCSATGKVSKALFVMRYTAPDGERVTASLVNDDHAALDVWDCQVFVSRTVAEEVANSF